MGSSYSISCKSCDYTDSFIIGIGMMYAPHNLKDFESENPLLPSLIRSKKTVDFIKELLKDKNAIIADDYGHEIYYCAKCGEFYGRFFIHLDYDGGSFEVDYKCPKCKAALERVDYKSFNDYNREEKKVSLEKYPCPKCEGYSLRDCEDAHLLWD